MIDFSLIHCQARKDLWVKEQYINKHGDAAILTNHSDLQDISNILCKMTEARTVSRLETSKQMREGGGFLVRRPIGDKISVVDPFLMLDHLGPVVYAPGEAIGAPDHPHRGFETVTYLIDGTVILDFLNNI